MDGIKFKAEHNSPDIKLEFVDCNNCEQEETVEEENTYKCVPCLLEFKDDIASIDHFKCCPYKTKESIRANSTEDVFVCIFCDLHILGETYYRKHERMCRKKRNPKEESINKSKQQDFKCDKCSFTTKSKRCLKRHRPVHSEQKQFKCEICERMYKHVSSLTHHKKVHQNERKKRFQCSYCDSNYYYKLNLIHHMNAKHLNNKNYKCDACDYATANKDHLKKHILVRHSKDEKQYKCKDCKYSTHFKKDLRAHLQRHSKAKPVKCHYEDCSYRSAQPRNLRQHVKRVHMKQVSTRQIEQNLDKI